LRRFEKLPFFQNYWKKAKLFYEAIIDTFGIVTYNLHKDWLLNGGINRRWQEVMSRRSS
jgi:hypothetical protein